MIDERQKFELGALWLDGVNTSVSPEAVPERQLVWGVNIDNKGGQISTRPGFSQVFQLGDGKAQMLEHFRSSNGTDYVIIGVNGRIYASLSPFSSFMDIGVQLDPNAEFFTHCVVTRGTCRVVEEDPEEGPKKQGMRNKIATRRMIIISDGGTNPPVIFDGSYARSSEPEKFGIPKCSWMAFSKNRLWVYDVLNKDIKWSDIDDPTAFYDVGFLADGGSLSMDAECTGMAALPDLGGDILVYERDKTWIINASIAISREGDWKKTPKFFRVIFPHVGCIAGKSFVTHYGDLWWWSTTGLTSFRRAQESIQDDELNPTDLEMSRSRKTFGSGKNAVTGISHENYFLMSMPTGDIWAKNNSPASLLNSNTSPAWLGVWTGLVPKEFCSFTRQSDGQRFTFALSADKDGRNRVWRLFRPDNVKQDNNSRISCSAEFRLHPFSGIFLEKKFLNFSVRLRNLWKQIDVAGFYRGTRGSWKQLLSKTIRVAEVLDDNSLPVTQTRRLTSSEADHLGGCQNACGESNRTENVDGAFQILLKWDGEMTIESYQVTAMVEDSQDFVGRCENEEVDVVLPDACTDPTIIDYSPEYREQLSYHFTLTATVPTFTCGYDVGTYDIEWPVISTDPDPDPEIPDIPVIIIIPDDTPIRTYTSTQSVTAYCVDGTGEPVVREASATSTISQSDADEQARAAAQILAELDLLCTWSSTKTVTVYCPDSTIGNPASGTASYTSTISQEDADEQATALATTVANGNLSCGSPPTEEFLFIGKNHSGFTQTSYPGRVNGGVTPSNTGVLWNGSRSIKDYGAAGLVDITGKPSPLWVGNLGPDGEVTTIGPNWICGHFSNYNGITRKHLAKISTHGSLDESKPDLFATPPAQPYLSNFLNSHFEGMDGFVAIDGTIRSFNGVDIGGTATYILFNPETLAIIYQGQPAVGRLIGHDNYHRRYFGWYGNNFSRISQAGVPDNTFLVDPVADGPNGTVKSLSFDFRGGLIYVAGTFTKWGSLDTPAGICRIFMSDGKADASFVTPTSLGPAPFPLLGNGVQMIALDYDEDGDVKAIYAPATHMTSGTGRIVKFNPNGSPDTRFKSPVLGGSMHVALKGGRLVAMSYSGSGCSIEKDATANFWTATDPLTYETVYRYGAWMLDKDSGQIYWPFNSDPDYIPTFPTIDFTKTNPGYFNGPITGIR